MVRVPVPDDYERGHVSVAGRDDYHYGQADVNLDDVDRARDVTVSEDEDGRYVGVSAGYADEVASFLGVDPDGTGGDEDAETCGTEKGDGEVCGRPLPCAYHSDDGGE